MLLARYSPAVAVVAGVLLALMLPAGYLGGHWDDGRYLEAAMAWAGHGAKVGTIHWALRWPVVLPAALAVHTFGLHYWVLMLPGLLAWTALLGTVATAVTHLRGRADAAVAVLMLVAIPQFHDAATRLTADLPDAMFGTVSLACAATAVAYPSHSRRWLAVAGAAAALAWATRETAGVLALIYGAAFLLGAGLPRKRWVWLLAGALPLVAAEHVVYARATGDWLYRLHVDLRHTEVASRNLAGSVAPGQMPALNQDVMARWRGAGPVRVWWPINPWVNLFLNSDYGQVFFLWGGLWVWSWRGLSAAETRILRWLAGTAAANVIAVTYIVATDPKPRMFMLACVSGAVAVALLAVHLWRRHGNRAPLAGIAMLKSVLLLVALDLGNSGRNSGTTAAQMIALADTPVHASSWTLNNLAPWHLAGVRSDFPRPGDLWLGFGTAGAKSAELLPPSLPGARWQRLARAEATRVPVIARLWMALGLSQQGDIWTSVRYPEPVAVLYRRLA